MSASLRLSDAEQDALRAYAERLSKWLKQFIDLETINSSVHFPALPQPQCQALCQWTPRRAQRKILFASVRQRPCLLRPRGRSRPSVSES